MDDQYAVDVDVEIAGIELEIEDTQRDMKFAAWITVVILVALFFFWDGFLSRTEAFVCAAAIASISGVKEHLYRNRLRQAHDQLVNLKLWAQAEEQNGRRVMRVVRAIAELP